MSDLSDRWDQMLAELMQFLSEHHGVDVPRSYVTASGRRLGAWLHRQRALAEAGTLLPDRHDRSDQVGVRWVLIDRETGIDAFRAFVETHGHGLVPHTYRTADGMALGVWVQSRRRQWQSDPLRATRLWPELEGLGFVWVVRDLAQQWEIGLDELRAYRREQGDTFVPVWHVTGNGFALGRWVDTRRTEYRAGTLSRKRVAALEDIGMVWRVRATQTTPQDGGEDARFALMRDHTVVWMAEHDGLLPGVREHDRAGVAVARWLGRQRHLTRNDNLSADRHRELDIFTPGWRASKPPRRAS